MSTKTTDPQTGATYIRFMRGSVCYTDELAPGIAFDYDHGHRLIGVEIAEGSEGMDPTLAMIDSEWVAFNDSYRIMAIAPIEETAEERYYIALAAHLAYGARRSSASS